MNLQSLLELQLKQQAEIIEKLDLLIDGIVREGEVEEIKFPWDRVSTRLRRAEISNRHREGKKSPHSADELIDIGRYALLKTARWKHVGAVAIKEIDKVMEQLNLSDKWLSS